MIYIIKNKYKSSMSPPFVASIFAIYLTKYGNTTTKVKSTKK